MGANRLRRSNEALGPNFRSRALCIGSPAYPPGYVYSGLVGLGMSPRSAIRRQISKEKELSVSYDNIPARRVSELLPQGAQVIDVRERNEVVTGMLPGAINIPLAQLEARLHQLSPDRPVAVVCEGGSRSREAATLLVRRGFRKVVNLDGGMAAARRR